MKNIGLLNPYKLGNIDLKNRIVMAPMTRSRAISNIPNELMAEYYGQRSAAGLIITEGTSPSPNGLGYSRIPGILAKNKWKVGRKSQKPCIPKMEKYLFSSCIPGVSAILRICLKMQKLLHPLLLDPPDKCGQMLWDCRIIQSQQQWA